MIQDPTISSAPSVPRDVPMSSSGTPDQPTQRAHILRWTNFFHTDTTVEKNPWCLGGRQTYPSPIAPSCLRTECGKLLEMMGNGKFHVCSVAPSGLQDLEEELFDLNTGKARQKGPGDKHEKVVWRREERATEVNTAWLENRDTELDTARMKAGNTTRVFGRTNLAQPA